MRRSIALMMLVLPIAACDQGTGRPAPSSRSRSGPTGRRRCISLNDLNRAIALKRAMHDSRAECRRVTKSGYVGEYENTAQWTATCEDKFKRTRDWALFIGPDESVQVRLCEDVVKAGLPACVIKDERETGPQLKRSVALLRGLDRAVGANFLDLDAFAAAEFLAHRAVGGDGLGIRPIDALVALQLIFEVARRGRGGAGCCWA